ALRVGHLHHHLLPAAVPPGEHGRETALGEGGQTLDLREVQGGRGQHRRGGRDRRTIAGTPPARGHASMTQWTTHRSRAYRNAAGRWVPGRRREYCGGRSFVVWAGPTRPRGV